MRRLLPVLAASVLAVPAWALDHSGTSSGVWRAADSPHHVLDSVSVPAGEVLVIEPGCTVVFAPSARLHVWGRLRAIGTSSAPVTFASAGPGTPGSWKGLALAGPGPHDLAWVTLRHATTGVQLAEGATLRLRDAVVGGCESVGVAFMGEAFGTIERTTFEDNGGSGLALLDSSPLVRDCRFTGNLRAAWISGDAFPEMSGLTATGNTETNGILVDALRPITGMGSWRDAGVPYVVGDAATLTIAPGAELVLRTGAVVKMGLGAQVRVEGVLSSFGRARVASLRDDSIAGDTNADGAGDPGKGDWDAIEVRDTGLVHLLGAEISHADDAVRALGGHVTLGACTLRDAGNRGLGFGPAATGYVEGTSFLDCEVGLHVTDATSVVAGRPGTGGGLGGNNSFGCNASYDVLNDDTSTIQIHRSWFGSAGPDWTRLRGDVDVGDSLLLEPAAVATRLRLTRPVPADVTFERGSGGSCARYRLAWSLNPGGSFTTLSWSDEPSLTLPVQSLPAGRLVFFEMEMER